MKRIYFIAVVLALSACSSQKYSNSHYQRLNNTDDAYFSPNDLKTKPKVKPQAEAEKQSGVEKYQPQNTPYYTNTNDETANPNAANRSTNPTQYTSGVAGNQSTVNQSTGNPNSLQGTPQTIINVYNQPWGAPFSPFYTMPYSNTISFNSWNNSWYIGPTFNAGWGYNPWGTWNTNPWFSYGYGGWGNCNPWHYNHPYYGYNSWGVYNPNPWVYDPWINQWVYDPWGNNFWGYNQPFFNTPNYGGSNTTYVRNAPRRTNNSFMPAVRNAIPNGGSQGGSRVIGATEQQAPANNSRNAPAVTNTGPTVAPSPGNNNGNAGTVTPSAPAYNPNTGRNPNTTPNAGAVTPSAPAYNPNAGNNSNGGTIAPNPNAYTPSRGSYNPGNVSPNNSGAGSVPNNSPAYQPRTPQPSVPASTPPRDVFSPRNGGNSGGGGSTGGGGGGGGRRR